MKSSDSSDQTVLCEATQQNAVVLGAVSGLIADVVRDVAGNEISNAIQGQTLTKDTTLILVNQELVEQFKKVKV